MAGIFTWHVAPGLIHGPQPRMHCIDLIKHPFEGETPPPGQFFLTDDTDTIDLTADDGTTLLLSD